MKKSIIVMLAVLGTSPAFAAKWGMAGCGLGSMVFADQPGFIQVVAATLNGTSGNQTFGMTSGTLNCTEGGGTASLNYIENNKVALQNDISRGQGDTLTGLLNMWGCENYSAVGSVLQQNYNQINVEQAASMKSSLQNVIKNNSSAGSCQSLI